MSIAAVLRELIAAGLSGDALVEAVERIEASKPRSSAAVRQQRYRDRQRESVTRDVTCVTDVTPVSLGSDGPPKEITSNPSFPPQPSENTQSPPARVAAKPVRTKANFHRLPDAWQPGPLPAALAQHEHEWPPGWLDDQAARFRGWAANAADIDGKGRKLNWDQAFHNWLRDNRTKGFDNGRNGHTGRTEARQHGPTPRVSAALEFVGVH